MAVRADGGAPPPSAGCAVEWTCSHGTSCCKGQALETAVATLRGPRTCCYLEVAPVMLWGCGATPHASLQPEATFSMRCISLPLSCTLCITAGSIDHTAPALAAELLAPVSLNLPSRLSECACCGQAGKQR